MAFLSILFKNIPGEHAPQPPLGACAFGAREAPYGAKKQLRSVLSEVCPLLYRTVENPDSLPLNIRQSLSLNEFKSKLKNYDFDSFMNFILFLYTASL